jgi:DNA-binding NtrC family response regulator
MADPSPTDLRWQTYLRQAGEPLFLLNHRRRLLFANRAWEECTGLSLAAVRGRPCRPPRASDADTEEVPLPAFAPPAEAMAGQTCRARRRALGPAAGWWQLDFFPLRGEAGLLGILGKITPLPMMPASSGALPERLVALRDRHAEAFRLDDLPSDLPAMQRVMAQARLASTLRSPVALVGEAGTGKHWLARAMHQAGPQRDRCFARIDTRALPVPLLAELLLQPRGQRLALGTVYIREPADLPRELQAELVVRIHGASESDGPRLIVGHGGDPAEAVRTGQLLEEFHCATSTSTVQLPPLRERLADLDGLIRSFLARARIVAEPPAMAPTTASAEATLALRGYGWPGNLRELYEVLRGAARRAKGERIELADLPFFLRSGPMPATKNLPLDALLEQAERRIILLALRQARGNRAQAAEILGIWRPRLLRRLEHFGIDTGAESDTPD